ncbi:hypothetical protein D0T53_11705 [Dysgonomonas sp. 216]|uniref:SGNH/GDSL hydrolase family protein n=1 Tax=Dysgonomonas sp. 216 TaxID=2302934 RepID=UPI0013D135ED|nr:SGNH/GDSL hydrolase family protein [Dysgonomonas sp. 216]NDW19571.1 hypothetical protein [Dysgonomonas sp. 216]
MKTTLKLLLLLLTFFCGGICSAQSLKSISILGDSYSTFDGYMKPDTNSVWYFTHLKHKTDVNSVRQTWWHQFIKQNGYKLCVNNSFSGATICNTGYRKEDYTDRSFITRMNNLGCPDVIFIFGGTNDSWANVPIGDYRYEAWTKDDLYKFRPAMAYMLHQMTDYYPNVEIYFLLNSELKDEINESVKVICEHYNIDCIELQNIDKKGSHPSIKGMKQISDQVKRYIEQKAN